MKISAISLLAFGIMSGIVGVLATVIVFKAHLDDNTIGGYHCTPITTHSSLESAKAQVRVYQDKARG